VVRNRVLVASVMSAGVIGGAMLAVGLVQKGSVTFFREARAAEPSTGVPRLGKGSTPIGEEDRVPGDSSPSYLFASLLVLNTALAGYCLITTLGTRQLVVSLRHGQASQLVDCQCAIDRLSKRLAGLEGRRDSSPRAAPPSVASQEAQLGAAPRTFRRRPSEESSRKSRPVPIPAAPSPESMVSIAPPSASEGEAKDRNPAPPRLFAPVTDMTPPALPSSPPQLVADATFPNMARVVPGMSDEDESEPEPPMARLSDSETSPSTPDFKTDRPFHETILPSAWSRFVEEDDGRSKGDWARLEYLIQARLTSGFVSIARHPSCEELAVVLVRQPRGDIEAHGLPVSDNYRNVMKFFEVDHQDGPMGYGCIRRVLYTALFRPGTASDPSGPELVEKGRVSL
jgi:hypothetical protein